MTAERARAEHRLADNVWKEATLENGLGGLVVPFVDSELIRVDVETGRYEERARGKR